MSEGTEGQEDSPQMPATSHVEIVAEDELPADLSHGLSGPPDDSGKVFTEEVNFAGAREIVEDERLPLCARRWRSDRDRLRSDKGQGAGRLPAGARGVSGRVHREHRLGRRLPDHVARPTVPHQRRPAIRLSYHRRDPTSHIRGIDTQARPIRYAGFAVPSGLAQLVRAKLNTFITIRGQQPSRLPWKRDQHGPTEPPVAPSSASAPPPQTSTPRTPPSAASGSPVAQASAWR